LELAEKFTSTETLRGLEAEESISPTRRSGMMWMRMMMMGRVTAEYPLLDRETIIGYDPRVFLRQLLDDGW
jgi:hypothetical protein